MTITGFCNVQAASEQVDAEDDQLPLLSPDEYPLLARLVDDVRHRRRDDRVFDAMVTSVVTGLREALAQR
jgi:hypothetical protein